MPTRKVREVISMLERDGWYEVTMRGSHRQFKHPTKAAASQWPANLATIWRREH
jgi:predicted RNA binding protein YcfA (HicA-like mRNA interferase family)